VILDSVPYDTIHGQGHGGPKDAKMIDRF